MTVGLTAELIPKSQILCKGCGLIMSRKITMNRTENKTFEGTFLSLTLCKI